MEYLVEKKSKFYNTSMYKKIRNYVAFVGINFALVYLLNAATDRRDEVLSRPVEKRASINVNTVPMKKLNLDDILE